MTLLSRVRAEILPGNCPLKSQTWPKAMHIVGLDLEQTVNGLTITNY
jgi:hypothetical protein